MKNRWLYADWHLRNAIAFNQNQLLLATLLALDPREDADGREAGVVLGIGFAERIDFLTRHLSTTKEKPS